MLGNKIAWASLSFATDACETRAIDFMALGLSRLICPSGDPMKGEEVGTCV